MSSSPAILERLSGVARSPLDLDLWIGALAEDPLDGALVGETFHAILSEQFLALRDGDRLWYARQLPQPLVQLAEQQSLSQILQRNSGLRGRFVETPFLADV